MSPGTNIETRVHLRRSGSVDIFSTSPARVKVTSDHNNLLLPEKGGMEEHEGVNTTLEGGLFGSSTQSYKGSFGASATSSKAVLSALRALQVQYIA